MASISEIETWFSILGAGMTGLRLLREYGMRTVELRYFVENFDKYKMRISAFAPPPLRDQYEPKFSSVKTKISAGIQEVLRSNGNMPEEAVNALLEDIKEMYMLLNDAHRTITSGIILV